MSNPNPCQRISLCLFLGTFLLATIRSPAQDAITTVAGGTWVPREGEAATNAPLGKIRGVEVDVLGNVIAADEDSHLVVKISPEGLLTVVAGNGINGSAGDGGTAESLAARTRRTRQAN